MLAAQLLEQGLNLLLVECRVAPGVNEAETTRSGRRVLDQPHIQPGPLVTRQHCTVFVLPLNVNCHVRELCLVGRYGSKRAEMVGMMYEWKERSAGVIRADELMAERADLRRFVINATNVQGGVLFCGNGRHP
jgi:hypothetical protein